MKVVNVTECGCRIEWTGLEYLIIKLDSERVGVSIETDLEVEIGDCIRGMVYSLGKHLSELLSQKQG